MKEYLLDTHIFLWWVSSADRLSQEVYEIIANSDNRIYISAASIWEIAIKESLGKLKIDFDLRSVIEQCGFNELKISAICANATQTLPLIHRDPFDRMLIAQAMQHNLTLISVDGFIRQYRGVKVMA